jgi:hypothetical protein
MCKSIMAMCTIMKSNINNSNNINNGVNNGNIQQPMKSNNE